MNIRERALLSLLIETYELSKERDATEFLLGYQSALRTAIAYMTGTHDIDVSGYSVDEWLPGLKELLKW